MLKLLAVLNCLTVGLLTGCDKAKSAEELLIESAQKVVAAKLIDPQSVQFRNIKGSERAEMVCGELNSKNSLGGYVGFQRFMVVGNVDATSHAFKAGALSLIEAKEPLAKFGITTPITSEKITRVSNDLVKNGALDSFEKLAEFIDALKVYDKTREFLTQCEAITSQAKQLDALRQERDAEKTVLDKVVNFFKGESS